MLNILIFAT